MTLSGLALLVVGAVLVWRSMDTRPPPRHLQGSHRTPAVEAAAALVPEQAAPAVAPPHLSVDPDVGAATRRRN
jgi:hypothetical protein